MYHYAEAVPKAHSARTIKLCSQRNAQLEVTVMCWEQSNQTTIIHRLTSCVNNACLEVNALLKALYIHRDALQVLTVQRDQINASLVLKVLIAAKLIQQLFLR